MSIVVNGKCVRDGCGKPASPSAGGRGLAAYSPARPGRPKRPQAGYALLNFEELPQLRFVNYSFIRRINISQS